MIRVIIGNKEIKLIDQNVKISKKLISELLEKSRIEAEAKSNYSFYYTLLIVMHIMSADYIRTLTPRVLALILNSAYAGDEKKRKAKLQQPNQTN